MEQAAQLTGYSLDTIQALVTEGILDWRKEGDTIHIEKSSLREYQEAWLDMRAVQLMHTDT